jgi:hypothetical protein
MMIFLRFPSSKVINGIVHFPKDRYGFCGPFPKPERCLISLDWLFGALGVLSVAGLGWTRRRLGASGNSKKSAVCKYLAASLGALAINCAAAFRSIGAA